RTECAAAESRGDRAVDASGERDDRALAPQLPADDSPEGVDDLAGHLLAVDLQGGRRQGLGRAVRDRAHVGPEFRFTAMKRRMLSIESRFSGTSSESAISTP